MYNKNWFMRICCSVATAIAIWTQPVATQSTDYKAPLTRDSKLNLNMAASSCRK